MKRQEYDRYGRRLPSQERMAYLEEQDQTLKSPVGAWEGLAEVLGDVFFGFLRYG